MLGLDFIALKALKQDIRPPINEGLYAHDPAHTALLENGRISVIVRFPTFFEQGHADTLAAHRRVVDHLTIPRLKNMERQIRVREENCIWKGEDWNPSGNRKRNRLVLGLMPRMLSLPIRLHGSR